MAKEKEEKGGEGKPKRKHLVEIRTEEAEDGTYVHHHTYADKRGGHREPERRNVATSKTPDEAGEHSAEQFGMNGPAQADPGAGEPAEGDDATSGGDPGAMMASGGAPGA